MTPAEELTEREWRLLEQRARLLGRREEVRDESFWVAQFRGGSTRYALPLESLLATLPLRAVTPVPLSAPHILGVLRFQGQIISALSLAALLGSEGWRVDPAVLLIVDPGWGAPVALDCEEIPKATALPGALRASAHGDDEAVRTIEIGGEPLRLIDPRPLLDRRARDRNAR